MAKTTLIVLGVVILILVVGFVILKPKEEAQNPEWFSFEEKQQVETWLKANDLNQYGDPKDTIYMGGTPLFDERTGKSIDRYGYILRRHPDRPWLK